MTADLRAAAEALCDVAARVSRSASPISEPESDLVLLAQAANALRARLNARLAEPEPRRKQTPVGSEEPTDAELRAAWGSWRDTGHKSLRGAMARLAGPVAPQPEEVMPPESPRTSVPGPATSGAVSAPAPAPSEDAPGAACSKCGEAFPSLRHREECVAAPSPPAPDALISAMEEDRD